MNSLFISRKEHDQLITLFPKFMQDEWRKFRRSWGIGGVIVKTKDGMLFARLRVALAAANLFNHNPTESK